MLKEPVLSRCHWLRPSSDLEYFVDAGDRHILPILSEFFRLLDPEILYTVAIIMCFILWL